MPVPGLSVAFVIMSASTIAMTEPSTVDDAVSARALREDADTAVKRGDYERAEALSRRAQQLDPREDFVYSLGTIAGAKGDCEAQKRLFQEYFDQIGYDGSEYVDDRYGKGVKLALEQMEMCEPSPAQPSPQVPTPAVAEPEPATVSAAADNGRERQSWLADPIGAASMAGGIAVAAGGTAAVVLGTLRHRAAREAGSEQGFADDQRNGQTIRGIGIGLIVVGGAAIVGGVVRYALVARRGRAPSTGRVRPGLGRVALRF